MDQKALSVKLFKLDKVCAFIFVFGLLGNGLTLWILVQSKKWKKNTTNMFIVSLTTVQDFDSTFKKYFAQSEPRNSTRESVFDSSKTSFILDG